MKKNSSLLAKLNIFTCLAYLLLFALIKTDIHIFGEPIVAIFVWAMPFVGTIVLLFIISAVIAYIKNKKLPDSFEYIISYLFTAISLCISAWFIYSFLDAWFDF